jgi:hypothetical protein
VIHDIIINRTNYIVELVFVDVSRSQDAKMPHAKMRR